MIEVKSGMFTANLELSPKLLFGLDNHRANLKSTQKIKFGALTCFLGAITWLSHSKHR